MPWRFRVSFSDRAGLLVDALASDREETMVGWDLDEQRPDASYWRGGPRHCARSWCRGARRDSEGGLGPRIKPGVDVRLVPADRTRRQLDGAGEVALCHPAIDGRAAQARSLTNGREPLDVCWRRVGALDRHRGHGWLRRVCQPTLGMALEAGCVAFGARCHRRTQQLPEVAAAGLQARSACAAVFEIAGVPVANARPAVMAWPSPRSEIASLHGPRSRQRVHSGSGRCRVRASCRSRSRCGSGFGLACR